MNRRSTAFAILLLSLAATAHAAHATAFLLVSSVTGKTIGRASFSIDKTKTGYKVQSRFEYRLAPSQLPPPSGDDEAPATGTAGRRRSTIANTLNEGQFSAEYKLDPDLNFLSGYTQSTANQLLTSFEPNKQHTEVTVNQTQAGVIGNGRDVPLPKPNFTLAPDFDPAPIQLLLTAALLHPHPDFTYLLLDPAGLLTKPGNETLYVTLQLAPGTRSGTLDAKPLTLKHYIMNFHTGRADLFLDDAGNLMEAQMGPLAIDYIRANFTLAP